MYYVIGVERLRCTVSNYDLTKTWKLHFKYSDMRGTFNRQRYHDSYESDRLRIDVYYNDNKTVNKILLYRRDSERINTLLQENLYKKGKNRKITKFGSCFHKEEAGKDEYVFKNEKILYKAMYIGNWKHTLIVIDHEKNMKYTHSYDQFGKRIEDWEKSDVYVFGESI